MVFKMSEIAVYFVFSADNHKSLGNIFMSQRKNWVIAENGMVNRL